MRVKLMSTLKQNRETERSRRQSAVQHQHTHSNSKEFTPLTIETTDISIRITSEPDQTPGLGNRTHRLKNSMSNLKELPRLTYRYLEPINQSSRKQIREEECRHLELLLELFAFRRDDRSNKEWNWLEEVIFKPRNFDKIAEYVRGRMDYLKLSA